MDLWSQKTVRKAVACAATFALIMPMPAAAQFGSFGSIVRNAARNSSNSTQDEKGCDKAQQSMGRSIIGGVLGRATRSTLGRFGSWVPIREVSGTLTDAIACQLDPEEQMQAADATLEVTRKGEVGVAEEWESDTRKNVKGSSTVTEKKELAGGQSCMSVTDVVIIEGEETTVSKQMCRKPGEKRYTILNA